MGSYAEKQNGVKKHTHSAFYQANPQFLGKYYIGADLRRSRCIGLCNWQYDELLKTLHFTPKFSVFMDIFVQSSSQIFSNSGIHTYATGTVG